MNAPATSPCSDQGSYHTSSPRRPNSTSRAARAGAGQDRHEVITPVPASRREFEMQALASLESLHRTAQLLMDDECGAQDLVQETFLRAYSVWHQSQSSPCCRLWLHKTMAAVLRIKYSLSPPLSAAIHSADAADHSPSNMQSGKEQPIDDSGQVSLRAMSRDSTAEAVHVLPQNLRLCAVLSLFEGMTHQEIAYIAGINIETIRSRLQAGSNRLLATVCIEHDSGRQERFARGSGRKPAEEPGFAVQNCS